MWRFLFHKHLYISIALIAVIFVAALAVAINSQKPPTYITTTVETGDVRELVSVSGVATAEQSAALAFPVTGIVSTVLVDEGSVVKTGDVLATIAATGLYADRQDAVAAVTQAIANRDELVAGPTATTRTVTSETLTQAINTLATTKDTEAQKVANAYETLLSSDLAAYSTDPAEEATPPTVSGTYTCDTEGTYTIEMFSSAAESGYSYHVSGLETGTYQASVAQPTPLGTCGLELLFDETSRYSRTTWYIDIPNTKSSQYVANRNAYSLAKTQAESAISLAEQAVALAEANAANSNATARPEAITRANAAVTQARARLARIDAQIADRTLTAPFAGVITEVSAVPGETVTTAPIMKLLADTDFEVTARIPEIDIGKLEVGQAVSMVFDARDEETLSGVISFISLQATEIDGVAYYQAIITPSETPTWMRSGLNADIEIIVQNLSNTTRIPTRFLERTDAGPQVLLLEGETITETPIKVLLDGNDGYVAITGVSTGTTVVAP